MALLDSQHYNKIIEVGKKAFESFRNDDLDNFGIYAERAWDLFPLPKEGWNQVYNFTKKVFKVYLDTKNLENAKLWLNRMIENNNCLHLFDADLTFNVGKYYFEMNEFEQAYEEWKKVVEDAGYRYFENEKPDYIEFYRNPQKYIDNVK